MILCDTNVIIEVFKGNKSIINELENIGFDNIAISSITIMELYIGALNKKELLEIKKNLGVLHIYDIDFDISKGAIKLIENYSKSHNLLIPDAIIAATALVNNISLFTFNIKDFNYIRNLNLYKHQIE